MTVLHHSCLTSFCVLDVLVPQQARHGLRCQCLLTVYYLPTVTSQPTDESEVCKKKRVREYALDPIVNGPTWN